MSVKIITMLSFPLLYQSPFSSVTPFFCFSCSSSILCTVSFWFLLFHSYLPSVGVSFLYSALPFVLHKVILHILIFHCNCQLRCILILTCHQKDNSNCIGLKNGNGETQKYDLEHLRLGETGLGRGTMTSRAVEPLVRKPWLPFLNVSTQRRRGVSWTAYTRATYSWQLLAVSSEVFWRLHILSLSFLRKKQLRKGIT